MAVRYKRVVNGRIVEIQDDVYVYDDNGVKLYARYADGVFSPFDNELVQVGWLDNGDSFSPPPGPTVSTIAASQKAQLQTAVKTAIEGGITLDTLGAPYNYPTDGETQRNVSAQVMKAKHDPDLGPFKVWCVPVSGDEGWERRGHNANQIVHLGLAIYAHVEALQDQYETLLYAIDVELEEHDAGSSTTAEAVANIRAIKWVAPIA